MPVATFASPTSPAASCTTFWHDAPTPGGNAMSASNTPCYSILIPEETVRRAAEHLKAIVSGTVQTGGRLRGRFQGVDLKSLSVHEYLGELIDTKQPQIFAESAIAGD